MSKPVQGFITTAVLIAKDLVATIMDVALGEKPEGQGDGEATQDQGTVQGANSDER